MDATELKPVLRAAAALRRQTAPLLRQTQTDVEQQRTEALLRNLPSTQEFLIPCPSPCLPRDGDSNMPPLRLLPHQKDGVRWLLAMHRHHRSAIVADEMGLGKTVQLLAFFAALAARGCFGTFLVVAPLSTLGNWAREAQKWVPWMHLTQFKGEGAAREKLRAKLRRRHRKAFQEAGYLRDQWTQPSVGLAERARGVAVLLGGIVLASYEMLMADKGALARLLPWDVVVVDEAQRLKRMDCRLLQQLHKANAAAMRVILSGTPVQNNTRELWTLMEFVAPEFVLGDGDRQVHAALDTWLLSRKAGKANGRKRPRDEREDSEQASTEANDSSLAMNAIVSELHHAMKPFLLRRTKATAGLSLPPKVQVILLTPLTPVQRQLYEAVQTSDAFLNNRVMHLRRCCLYPGPIAEQLTAALANHGRTAATAKGEKAAEKKARALFRRKDRYTPLSSKLALLADMLTALHAANHRVLLFSQFTSVLDVLEDFLSSVLPSLSYARLDGSTSGEDRTTTTAQFQATPPPRPSGGGGGNAAARRDMVGNVENGIAEDDLVFSTPPPPPPTWRCSIDAATPPLRHRRPLAAHAANICHASIATPTASGRTPPPRQPPQQQQPQPQQRTEKAFLFLVSTRAGGAGLNLTGADTVVLFDGDFNPHNDHQAIDRCHRIGQRRPVAVYRLVCPGTVEADQLAVARRKLLLEKAVLGDTAEDRLLPRTEEEEGIADVLVGHAGPDAASAAVSLTPLASWPALLAEGGETGSTAEMSPSSPSLNREQLAQLLDRQWLVAHRLGC